MDGWMGGWMYIQIQDWQAVCGLDYLEPGGMTLPLLLPPVGSRTSNGGRDEPPVLHGKGRKDGEAERGKGKTEKGKKERKKGSKYN